MELIINEKNPSLCLNMIVKNESKIITRLLNSVLPIIDCYCICDTGSTDNTVEIIESFFSQYKITGKILNVPFVNFEYNRNEALKYAYGMSDYILLLDADMILDIKNFKKKMLLNYDAISILQGSSDFYYKNLRIIKNNNLFKYVGVTHEYISYSDINGSKITTFDKDILFIKDYGDGGCKSDKYERDIKLLLKGIEDEPNNIRYYFYLANSYHDCGQYEKAIEYYNKRIELDGWFQEQWFSSYRIGLCYKHLNNIENAIYYWLQAYELFPRRIENLYEIINYYRNTSKHKLALMFLNIAKSILNSLTDKEKNEFLFLQNDKYVYKLDYEYSIIAYYLGIKQINNEIIKILNNSNEESITRNLLSNIKFYRNIIKPLLVKDFTNQISYDINGESIKFNSSSSCLIKNPNIDGYMMNVRYVNYNITNNGSYLNCDKNIITLNKYIKLTNDFNIIEEKIFELNNDNRKYLGIEDIKIFNNSVDNKTIFIGTTLHNNEKLGLSYGKYDISNNMLVNQELKTQFTGKICEKNWVYAYTNNELYIIYEWYPLKICKIDSENNSLNIIAINNNLPKIFENLRGSTCGFNYKNELWFITHLVDYSKPRNYYHLLVVLDENFNILRYSAPFNFEGEPIEYCLSLLITDDDDVIINYSTWDRTTKIAIYKKNYIDNLLVYNI
jgi:glycosyltransferase involved in cell wall biosynthesis